MRVRTNIRPPRTPRLYVILSERLAARRSFGSEASRNGQNQAPWRAGIYEGAFVTFHRQSYFSLQIGGSKPPPYVEGNGRCTECAPRIFTATHQLQNPHSPIPLGGEEVSKRKHHSAMFSRCEGAKARSFMSELFAK